MRLNCVVTVSIMALNCLISVQLSTPGRRLIDKCVAIADTTFTVATVGLGELHQELIRVLASPSQVTLNVFICI